MKYIKTYEQLIPNYLKDLKSLKDKYVISVKNSIQEIIDDYNARLSLSILDPDMPMSDDDDLEDLFKIEVTITKDDDIESFLKVLGSSLYKLNNETSAEVESICVISMHTPPGNTEMRKALFTASSYEDLVNKINTYKALHDKKNPNRSLFDLSTYNRLYLNKIQDMHASNDIFYIMKHEVFSLFFIITLK